MLISKDKKIVIFCPAKNGTTTMKQSFAMAKGNNHPFDKIYPNHRHSFPDDVDQSLIEVTIIPVRNSYQRMISAFHFFQRSRRQMFVTKMIKGCPYTQGGFEKFCKNWAAKRDIQLDLWSRNKKRYDMWVMLNTDYMKFLRDAPGLRLFRLEDGGVEGLVKMLAVIDPKYASIKLGKYSNATSRPLANKRADSLPNKRPGWGEHFSDKALNAIGDRFDEDISQLGYSLEGNDH